jgi:hypothetical protein
MGHDSAGVAGRAGSLAKKPFEGVSAKVEETFPAEEADMSVRTPLLALLAALSGGCSSGPPAAGAVAQYLCPNGLIVRAGYSADRHLLLLTLQGATRTLTRNEATGAWSNGNLTVTVDDRFLHLDRHGHLLTQHCRLQIPAAGRHAP